MRLLMEYLYCCIYVCGLIFCVYQYLDREPQLYEYILCIFIYGGINFLITGDYIISIHLYMFINILVIVGDFFMLCVLNKKINFYLLFYSILYAITFLVLVNIIMYFLELSHIMTILESYNFSIHRFMLIGLFNGFSVIIFKLLKRYSLIPEKEIIHHACRLFNLVNILCYMVLFIFFGTRVNRIDNIYTLLISVAFFIMWLILIRVINDTIELSIDNEKDIISKSILNNIEEYIHQQQDEEQKIKKIKHDMRNHLILLKNISSEEKVIQYIQELDNDFERIDHIKRTFTGNIYLDSIISVKEKEYPNVKFKYSFRMKNLVIAPKDLSSLVFNLVDNAAKAAGEVDGKVFLKIIYDTHHLFIEVINDCIKKPNFLSTEKNHGYGLSIIKDIVNKYDGDIEIGYKNNKVNCKISLCI